MKAFGKAIALLTRRERRKGYIVLVLMFGMALLETAGIASVAPFLAVLGNPNLLITDPLLGRLYSQAEDLGVRTSNDFLILLGLGSFVIIILSAGYRTVTQFIINRYVTMLQHSLGVRLLENYLNQPYAFFLDRNSSDMSKSILSEAGNVVGYIFYPALHMLAYSLVMVAIVVLLLLVDPWLALLAAGVLGGLYVLVFLTLKNKLTRLGRVLVSTNTERFMIANEAFGSIKDIKLLGQEQSYLKRFSIPSQKYAAAEALNLTINLVPKHLIEAVAFGGLILAVLSLMTGPDGLNNNSLGQVLPVIGLYAFSAYRLQPALQNIFSGLASLRFGQAAVDNLYADLYYMSTKAGPPREASVPLTPTQTIELRNLSFSYPNAGRLTLVDLNLRIPVGSSVGLVGGTGAGKTTLINILLGLLRPTSGEILVDGKPLTDDQVCAWQRSLGYVPQDIFLIDASVSENIALGVLNTQVDNARVERCAKIAQLHDFISHELPDGYDTCVGERGVRLSGGQRQRIGIARALYNDPEVLVLDEATSALDAVTERAVMDAIDGLKHSKTVIIVAHRLSTVSKCESVIYLDRGVMRSQPQSV